ncbi:50S ribosomal protein L29 [Candidatus Kaiserbacteria bacterium]|nr:50S ribosomal protein L29 [Candidatus Kaiserbacteria bacterium]
MADISSKSIEVLKQELTTLRESLRSFRFGGAGSRARNVRQGSTIRKEIARVLTELRKRTLTAAGIAKPEKTA